MKALVLIHISVTLLIAIVARPALASAEFGYLRAPAIDEFGDDLGVEFLRLDLPWIALQTEQETIDGVFDWEGLESDYWRYQANAGQDLEFLISIRQLGANDRDSYIPDNGGYNESNYVKYVETVVERYDGDGTNDCPDLIAPVRCFQIENEVTLFTNQGRPDYARLLAISYDAIKRVCPDARVVSAGTHGAENDIQTFDDHMVPILTEIAAAGRYEIVEVFDFHWFKFAEDYDPTDYVEYMKTRFDDLGFDTNALAFWCTENSTHSGDPASTVYPYQTEKDQAISLVRRFVCAVSAGVERVCYAWGVYEGFKFNGGPFDCTGLIYDGNRKLGGAPYNNIDWADADPYDRGFGVKKLAYYGYKRMTEKLGGFSHVETIARTNGVYIYKFVRDGEPVWVAWYDSADTTNIELAGITSDHVVMSDAVPLAEFGEYVPNDPAAFPGSGISATSGSIQITLGDKPIYIEEDMDGDLLSDHAEAEAGTDPNDKNDVLRVVDLYPTQTGWAIEWEPKEDRVYGIEWSSNLLTGIECVVNNLNYPTYIYTNTTDRASASHFYRVRVR